MFSRDRCCLDLHYQIHPAAKHLVDFYLFSEVQPINDNHTRAHSVCSEHIQLVFIEKEKRNHRYTDV